jgi:hypothetical protein
MVDEIWYNWYGCRSLVAAVYGGIVHSGVASAPSEGDPIGNSGMERPGVYPVEVVTVLNVRTVTVAVRRYLKIREEQESFVYILLDMTSWHIMERDSVGRRGDGLVFNFHKREPRDH